jgi:hypothetical protein
MLRNSSVLAGLFAIGMMVSPQPVRADTIPITAGTFTILPFDRPLGFPLDTIHLEGPRGFTLDAFNISPSGRHNVHDCEGPASLPCSPGDRVSLSAGSSGSDLGALVTLDGQTFGTGLGSETQGSALVQFTGSFLVPSFTGVEAVSVLSPFSFFGTVTPPGGSSVVQLVGRGTARVDLARLVTPEFGQTWDFQRAVYEFQTPAVIPEPATLVLVGSGIAGCLIRRKRTRPAPKQPAACA